MALLETSIVRRQDWAAGLATFTLAERLSFRPGQFVNLGLYLSSGFVSRSYSVASAPGQPLEFLLARVPEGALSPSLFELFEGGKLHLDPTPQGFFSFDYVPPHEQLWMIATGTGLGPFLSMLRSGKAFEQAQNVVLAHGVRGPTELAHRDELEALQSSRAGRFRFVPLLSREALPGAFHGRVTLALANGALEELAGAELSPHSSHVMLCGNPQMVDDVIQQLTLRGLRRHRQRAPGHITTEKYW